MRGSWNRPGFRGFNGPGVTAAGTGAQGGTSGSGPVPAVSGGNSVQGDGIDFIYQTPNVASLANGAGSGAQDIQFDNNSTFWWLRTTFTVDINAAAFLVNTQPIPLITVQIQDTGNGMSFMNAPIPIYAMAGYIAGLPYILPKPQFIQPNASYSFTFANYDAAVTYTNLRLQLHGARIFNS